MNVHDELGAAYPDIMSGGLSAFFSTNDYLHRPDWYLDWDELGASPEGQATKDEFLHVYCVDPINVSGAIPEVVQWLVEHGCNTESTNEHGETVLWDVINNCPRDYMALPTIRVLLESGADPNALNSDGQNLAFVEARAFGTDDLVGDVLFRKNVDINLIDDFGLTPIHHMIRWLDGYNDYPSETAQVHRFIDNGADLRIRNGDGELPLDMLTKRLDNKRLEDDWDEDTIKAMSQLVDYVGYETGRQQGQTIKAAVDAHLTEQAITKPFVQEPNIAQTMRDGIAGPVTETQPPQQQTQRQTRRM